MKDIISRRSFLRHSGAGITALAATGRLPLPAAGSMPMRTLGKTGLKVSMLAFGSGSQFLLAKDGEWEPLLERAVTSGINLFDTSSGYQWKSSTTSEDRLGKVLPRFRKSVYVSTKFESRDPEKARKEFDRSLQRLNMDYVDLLLIHSIEESEDIAALEKGVYKMLMKLKEEKLTRFAGFSSMNSAARSKELLEKLDVDVAILAMNPTKYGDFAKVALPVARAKKVGVIAMKLMRDIVGESAKPAELLHYAWTLPGVASAVVGHVKMSQFEENLQHAQSFTADKAAAFDRRRLELRLSHLAGPHALCWARPGYRDSNLV
ncbi:MAG TPA: aldo/keto reductase [Acidobacteriota bacterium]|nr:aldo/keto reductase [Acidobacteriota bacterium]